MSADGVLYCLTNKSTLYALDASSGAIKWQQSLDGATGSAVAIDKAGNVYAGTSAAIYSLNRIKSRIEIGRSECDRTSYVCFEGSGTLCDFEKWRTRCC